MDATSEAMPVENSRLSGFFKLSVDERRKLVQNYCNAHRDDATLFNENFKDFEYWTWFDYKHELFYCQVNKVGTTTWIHSLKQ